MNLEYLSRVGLMSLDMSGSSTIASISSLKKMMIFNENEGHKNSGMAMDIGQRDKNL